MTPSTTSTAPPTQHRRRGARPAPSVRALAALALAGVSTTAVLVGSVGSAQAATPVLLGTAGTFSVLAGAGVTNTGRSTLAGDLGTFPTMTVTGRSTLVVGGSTYAGGPVARQAQDDLTTAYGSAAGQTPASPVVGDLGGRTLAPGVYGSASSLALTGVLTLDAKGDPSAVFVLKAGSTLTTASASNVLLIGGAQACNVFWQVGSSATLGSDSNLRGSVLALTSITLTTRAAVEGRLLARNGTVVLDTNTVTRPGCLTTTPPAAPASPSPTLTPSPSPSPSSSPTPDPVTSPTVTPVVSPTPSATPVTTPSPTPVASPGTPSLTPSATPTVAVPSGSPAPPSPAPPTVRPSIGASPAAPAAAASPTSRQVGVAAPVAAPFTPGAPLAAPTTSGAGSGVPTAGQVDQVPVGPVAAGDGSAAGPGRARSAASSVTLLGSVGLALALGLLGRRRTT